MDDSKFNAVAFDKFLSEPVPEGDWVTFPPDTIRLKELQFGVMPDKEFANYLVDYLKVFADLGLHLNLRYDENRRTYYLVGFFPLHQDADYIKGLVDGMVYQYKRMK